MLRLQELWAEVEVPQFEYEDQIVEVPVAKQVQVPMIQKIQKSPVALSEVQLGALA